MEFRIWLLVAVISLVTLIYAGADWLLMHWPAVGLGSIVAAVAAYAAFRDRRIKRLRDLGPLYTKSQDTWRDMLGVDASSSTHVDNLNQDWWRLVRETQPMLSVRGYLYLEGAFHDCSEIANILRNLAGSEGAERRELLEALNRHKKFLARKREDLTRERSLLIDWWPRPVGRLLRRLRLI
jgi:hypothetical protein